MPRTVCSEPSCPQWAVHRGRCATHRQTDAQRGMGAAHRRDRRAHLPGATCEGCGCTHVRYLQRDHRIPASLGGTEDASNKRWLCRSCPVHGSCHDSIGVRVDRTDGPVANPRPSDPFGPRAASFRAVRPSEPELPPDRPLMVIV